AGTAEQGPGASDSYTMRLTKAPIAPVNIDVITDGQTDIIPNGGQIKLGGTGLTQTLKLSNNVNIKLHPLDPTQWTITRPLSSELGSWIADGFMAGQIITIAGTGVAGVDGTYKIDSGKGAVTDQVIKLSNEGGAVLPSVAGTYNSTSGNTISLYLIKSNGIYPS